MARWKGTTTQRGLGWSHVRDRRGKMAALRDGEPCPYCGRGMFRGQALELDHYPGRVFGGPQVTRLAHARCNRAAGARMGNRLRGMASGWSQSRRW
jgi:hypothetical protein